MSTSDDQFGALFDRYAGRVRSFARRYGDAATADDIVSETFLVAWRRRAELPPDPLPWLLVTARNIARNQRRRFGRDRLRAMDATALESLARAEPDAESPVVARSTMLAALAELTALEREAVLLVAWDGLAPADAARVAGCSVRAFTVRLHRARQRLTRLMGDLPVPVHDHEETR